MINLRELEIKALREVKETAEKVVSSFVELAENTMYEQLKLDVAVNGKISEEKYEIQLPFNPRMSPGFDTDRSCEHGMTNAELLETVIKELNTKGYEAQTEDNGFGEKSVLSVVLKVK